MSGRDTRDKRDLHALDGDGMLVCNPRDREAAHRAEVEGIATGTTRPASPARSAKSGSRAGEAWQWPNDP